MITILLIVLLVVIILSLFGGRAYRGRGRV